MKSPYFAAAAILLIIAIALAGCAPVGETSIVSRPIGSREYVGTGEIVLRVETREGEPEMFENPGSFGKIGSQGFSELCYVGLNAAKQPVFRRRDVHTVPALPPQPPPATLLSKAAKAPPPPPPPLPEATVEFTVDYSKGRLIAMRGRVVQIIDATPAGVTFSVQ
jgi:hypothetical protein